MDKILANILDVNMSGKLVPMHTHTYKAYTCVFTKISNTHKPLIPHLRSVLQRSATMPLNFWRFFHSKASKLINLENVGALLLTQNMIGTGPDEQECTAVIFKTILIQCQII